MPKSVRGVMDEYKHGQLHSGSSSGPRVTTRRQAVAIALSEQRQRPVKRSKRKSDTESHAFDWRDKRRKHNR